MAITFTRVTPNITPFGFLTNASIDITSASAADENITNICDNLENEFKLNEKYEKYLEKIKKKIIVISQRLNIY